jgi:1,4-alpha-glucan branching enzyme
MGQEILEDKPWSDTPALDTMIFWAGLDHGDKAMVDFLRFTTDLIALRRHHPALTGEGCAVVHVHDDNRVLAFHRWTDAGDDLMIVCTLSETTWRDYATGFPAAGEWREVFNSDVYDHWVNPMVSGNGPGPVAGGGPLHGMPASADIVVPANSILMFSRSP